VCVWTQDGATPLHFASCLGQAEVAQTLIEAGADATIKNNVSTFSVHVCLCVHVCDWMGSGALCIHVYVKCVCVGCTCTCVCDAFIMKWVSVSAACMYVSMCG